MSVSRADQEVLNTSSRLPSRDLRSASSGRRGLAGHAAVQSIKCDVGASWTASKWRDQSIWAGAAWLNVPCCACFASRCEGPCATSEDREFSAVTWHDRLQELWSVDSTASMFHSRRENRRTHGIIDGDFGWDGQVVIVEYTMTEMTKTGRCQLDTLVDLITGCAVVQALC